MKRKTVFISIVVLLVFVLQNIVIIDAEGLDATIDYQSIQCGSEITFTVNADGGTGNYKYRFNAALDYEGNNIVDPTRFSYQTSNKFKFTFYASGKYELRFDVMDMASYTYNTIKLSLNINDPNYPTIEEKVNNVAQACIDAGNTSDYDKALWLHDWLLDNCTYDNSFVYCSAEGALCRGTGICDAYHRAYEKLLNKVGISTGRIESFSDNHVWTAAKLDGNWYQIDATWDDNGYSATDSYECHLYFGLTDDIIKLVHKGHSAKEGYISNSLENNYLIKSGKITQWSNPLLTTIKNEIKNNRTSFDITISNVMPEVYNNVIYKVAAYKLASDGIDIDSVHYDFDASYLYGEYNNGSTGTLTISNVHNSVHTHSLVIDNGKAPTCTDTGLSDGSHCETCNQTLLAQEILPALGHDFTHYSRVESTTTKTGNIEYWKCNVCHKYFSDSLGTNEISENSITIPVKQIDNTPKVNVDSSVSSVGSKVYIDGQPKVVNTDGYVTVEKNSNTLITYNIANNNNSDIHVQYPTSMSVYLLEDDDSGNKVAIHHPNFDNILTYAGASIRVTGKKGIRIITTIPTDKKNSLINDGIDGYVVMEYGTLMCWASNLEPGKEPVIGATGVAKGRAYSRDANINTIYKESGGKTQYTNTLVGDYTDQQCNSDFAMRSYMIIRPKNASDSSRDVVLYGGTLYRSISYVALQNKNAFKVGSDGYEYIWKLIKAGYPDIYASEYKGVNR